jgi:hypothetical protein
MAMNIPKNPILGPVFVKAKSYNISLDFLRKKGYNKH